MRKKLWPWIALGGAVVFVLAVIAVTVGLIFGPGDVPGDDPEERSVKDSAASAEKDDTEDAPDAARDLGVSAPRFDGSGLVEMAVTSDPRVAAASAAQVLSSVDTTKMQWVDDFRSEVLTRVMVPSEDFVGAGDGIKTHEVSGNVMTYDDAIREMPERLADVEYSPTGFWWMLGDTREFRSLTSYGAIVEATPIEVYDQAEMVELTNGASWTKPADYIEVEIAEDASYGLYWVRLETTTQSAHGEVVRRDPVALSIYCDPPSLGGVCAVEGLMTGYPASWQNAN